MGLTRQQAVQASVMLIGGVALSRAVTDNELKAQIVDNCLAGILKLAESTEP